MPVDSSRLASSAMALALNCRAFAILYERRVDDGNQGRVRVADAAAAAAELVARLRPA